MLSKTHLEKSQYLMINQIIHHIVSHDELYVEITTVMSITIYWVCPFDLSIMLVFGIIIIPLLYYIRLS